jgi:serine/threonine-protein kinase
MASTAAHPSTHPMREEAPEVLRWQFLRSLRASRLISNEDVDLIEREAPDAHAEDIQQMLLDQGLLTPYQLRRIREGKAAGLVLGQYRILDELGAGGFGQVFKANHTVLDRVVALKLMTREYSQSRLFREVFRREVAAVTRLNHPNIAATFDANEIDGALFLAMEYVEGTTLHAFVCDNDPPPIPVACAIMRQLAEALRHAHENGLIHRDIKPANVLVAKPSRAGDPDGVLVKMIDFGLARLYPRGDQPTGTLLADAGAIVGTPAYMSPEQACNFHEADGRSDLYSLGCTFYFLLTARAPFEGASSRLTLEMHASKHPRPLRDLRPDVPHAVAELVQRLMAKRPEDRFQTAAELSDALQQLDWLGPPPAPAPYPAAGAGNPVSIPPLAPDPAARRVALGPDGPATRLTEPSRWADPIPAADLRRLWLGWCVVVEAVARGEPVGTTAAEYADLYRSLLGALEQSGGDAPTAVQRDRIVTLIEPWVTLKTLRALDPSSVRDLWRTCQEYDGFFEAHKPRAATRRWWTFLGRLAAGAGVVSAARPGAG